MFFLDEIFFFEFLAALLALVFFDDIVCVEYSSILFFLDDIVCFEIIPFCDCSVGIGFVWILIVAEDVLFDESSEDVIESGLLFIFFFPLMARLNSFAIHCSIALARLRFFITWNLNSRLTVVSEVTENIEVAGDMISFFVCTMVFRHFCFVSLHFSYARLLKYCTLLG